MTTKVRAASKSDTHRRFRSDEQRIYILMDKPIIICCPPTWAWLVDGKTLCACARANRVGPHVVTASGMVVASLLEYMLKCFTDSGGELRQLERLLLMGKLVACKWGLAVVASDSLTLFGSRFSQRVRCSSL